MRDIIRHNEFKIYLLMVLIMTLINFYYRPIKKNELITDTYKKSSSYVNNLYHSEEIFKKGIVAKRDYYIYEQIINDLKNGKYTSTIACKINGCAWDVYYANEAILLDHPELIALQTASYSATSEKVVLKYSRLDPIRTYLGTKRIAREIDIVKKETKNMNDKEKIIFVYNYVASHNYDRLFRFANSNQSAYSFFTKGTSVCAGFAKSSQILFQNIGINSYLVMGHEHMWNYVEYNGKYYVFDATVGASYRNKQRKEYYDGLGKTTVNKTEGLYKNLYPKIESTTLRELFGV